MKEIRMYLCPNCNKNKLRFSKKKKSWNCVNWDCEAEFSLDQYKLLNICPSCVNQTLSFNPVYEIYI